MKMLWRQKSHQIVHAMAKSSQHFYLLVLQANKSDRRSPEKRVGWIRSHLRLASLSFNVDDYEGHAICLSMSITFDFV